MHGHMNVKEGSWIFIRLLHWTQQFIDNVSTTSLKYRYEVTSFWGLFSIKSKKKKPA